MRRSFSPVLIPFVAFFSICLTQIPLSPALAADTGIEGVISVGPVPNGPSTVGGSKPLAHTTFVVLSESKNVITSFTTDDHGHFRILLAPGHYSVSRKDAQPKVGRFGPFEINVAADRVTNVAWTCDSGMR